MTLQPSGIVGGASFRNAEQVVLPVLASAALPVSDPFSDCAGNWGGAGSLCLVGMDVGCENPQRATNFSTHF